jgi:hypothetical protein
MSAPHEVTLCPQCIEEYESAHIGTPKDSVRYLRADLTCGECAKHGKHNECAHDYANHDAVMASAAKNVWPNHGSPACMAFVPKGEK